MLVTLPFLLLLLDFWPLRRFSLHGTFRALPRLVLEKWHWFLLAALVSVITRRLQTGAVTEAPLLPRLATLPSNYLFYFAKSFWPSGLMPLADGFPSTPAISLLAAVLFLILAVLAAVAFRRVPGFAVGLLAFAGLLFPVSGIVFIGSVPVADRYAYLPAIGLSLALANLLQFLLAPPPNGPPAPSPTSDRVSCLAPSPRGLPPKGRVGETPPCPPPLTASTPWPSPQGGSRPQAGRGSLRLAPPSSFIAFIALIVFSALSAVTLRILPAWKNPESFVNRIAAVSPEHYYVVATRFKTAFAERGDPRAALEPALRLFARRPSNPFAVNAVLLALSQLESSQAALDFFAAHPPADFDLHSEELLSLDLAVLFADVGDCDSALARLDAVLASDFRSRRNTELILSVAYWVATLAGQRDRALGFAGHIPSFDADAPFAPENSLLSLTTIWNLGLRIQALPHFLRLARDCPGNPALLNNVAWILSTSPNSPADPADAVSIARQALDLSPGNPVLRDTLAVALAFAGNFDEAASLESDVAADLRAAPSSPVSSILPAVEKRLALFASHRPFTEDSSSRLLYAP